MNLMCFRNILRLLSCLLTESHNPPGGKVLIRGKLLHNTKILIAYGTEGNRKIREYFNT